MLNISVKILLEYDPAVTIWDFTGFDLEAPKENDNGCGEACREGKEEEEKKEVEHIVYLYLHQH